MSGMNLFSIEQTTGYKLAMIDSNYLVVGQVQKVDEIINRNCLPWSWGYKIAKLIASGNSKNRWGWDWTSFVYTN